MGMMKSDNIKRDYISGFPRHTICYKKKIKKNATLTNSFMAIINKLDF